MDPNATQTQANPAPPSDPNQAPSAQTTQAANRQGKVIQMTRETLAKQTKDHQDRGRQAAQQELEQQAKTLGFANAAEMISAASKFRQQGKPQNGNAQGKAQPAAQPNRSTEQPKPNHQNGKQAQGKQPVSNNNKNNSRDEKVRQQLTADRERAQKKALIESRRRRDLQLQLDNKNVEMVLREAAVSVGVTDVDYAIRLLERANANKTLEEMKGFDERAFFAGLRESKPYLFGETVRPANTGPGVGTQPTAPKPGTVTQTAAAGHAVDANKLSADDFQKLLRSRGLNQPSAPGNM